MCVYDTKKLGLKENLGVAHHAESNRSSCFASFDLNREKILEKPQSEVKTP